MMKPRALPSTSVDRTLVAALRRHLEAETGRPVVLLETHISWVLLTEHFAYKLKKPVRLPFVDFSTPALRLHSCAEEVRLNRRLAPCLYLDVVPVCGTPHAPRIGGGGEAVDHAVRMRRFPPGALFSELLAAGQLHARDLERLARRLAVFHRDAPVDASSPAFGTPQRVLEPVLDVLSQLAALYGEASVAAAKSWIGAQAGVLDETWLARRRDGAVRECHGDLHLANVVRLGDEMTAFDCIEFDPALRWIDVMNDIAFLTMDLKAHGRSDLAFGFLDDYLQQGGDYAGLSVLPFYELYRALVRALVDALRRRDAGNVQKPCGPGYLAFAGRLAQPRGGMARLLITHGLSGSGKSTVARRLLEAAGAVRLRSDVERKRLFGLGALQRSLGLPIDIYSAEATRQTFERLVTGARAALRAGYPVIVDAAFLRRAERTAFRALAGELHVPFAILHCRADEATLRRRVAERRTGPANASEATLDVLENQLKSHEPLDADERALALEIDTREPLDMAGLCAHWTGAAPGSG